MNCRCPKTEKVGSYGVMPREKKKKKGVKEGRGEGEVGGGYRVIDAQGSKRKEWCGG